MREIHSVEDEDYIITAQKKTVSRLKDLVELVA